MLWVARAAAATNQKHIQLSDHKAELIKMAVAVAQRRTQHAAVRRWKLNRRSLKLEARSKKRRRMKRTKAAINVQRKKTIRKRSNLKSNSGSVPMVRLRKKLVKDAVCLATRRAQILDIQQRAHERWSQVTFRLEHRFDLKNRKLSFLNNRSQYLSDIMRQDGWVAHVPDNLGPVDFTYWTSRSGQEERRGALSQLPRASTALLDNKKSCYLLLLANGLSSLMPPTFLTLDECVAYAKEQAEQAAAHAQPAAKENTSEAASELWFLKKNGASCQRAVEVFVSLSSLEQSYSRLECASNWVIQAGLCNPWLLNGCKTTLRVYALITGDRAIYIYHRGVWAICSKRYDARDADRQAQCDHKLRDYEREVRRCFDAGDPHYAHIVACSKRIVQQSVALMADKLNAHQIACCFHLFGFDLIFERTPDMRPWLIEINHYPSLRGTFDDGDGDQHVKRALAADLYHFVVKPFFFEAFQPSQECCDHWLRCKKPPPPSIKKALPALTRKKEKARRIRRKLWSVT